MQQAHFTLHNLGIRVLVVTFENRLTAAEYIEETGVDWPVLIDEQRKLYRAYGLESAKLRHLIGPQTLLAYAREAMRGQFPRWPGADAMQQGGDILIDATGIIRFHHIGAGAGYRPTVDKIFEARRTSRPLS